MKIDGKGYTLDTLDDILTAVETALRAKYGEEFYIKAEGVIDNLVTSMAFQLLSLEEQIAYLIKQFDPETAEDEFQDALYERLLVYRIKAEKTIVERTIVGTPGINVAAGEVTIRNKATMDEFINKNEVTIGADGKIVADFECVLFGPIDLPENADIEVVAIPLGVSDVITEENPKIDIGRNRETNEEYKVRFRKEKSRNARATRNANYSNLGHYVDDESYLNVIDKKTDNEMEPGTLKIVANHNTTNTTFANAIFETVADGIDTIGTTSVTVKDNAGQDVVINWINAGFVEVAISANVKPKPGIFFQTLVTNIKNAIIEYVQNRVYGLGQTVYANEFIIPIFGVEGVENATNIQVGIQGQAARVEELAIDSTKLAMFSEEWITINEIS